MLETSRDVLNWTLAISLASLIFFLCWTIYYFIAALRRGLRVIKTAENILAKAENLLDSIKSKLSNSASYILMFGELVQKLSHLVKDHRRASRYNDEDEFTDRPPSSSKKKDS